MRKVGSGQLGGELVVRMGRFCFPEDPRGGAGVRRRHQLVSPGLEAKVGQERRVGGQ